MSQENPKSLSTQIAVMHNDIKWIRDEVTEIKNFTQDHEKEHKGMFLKLMSIVVILTSAIAGMIAYFIKS